MSKKIRIVFSFVLLLSVVAGSAAIVNAQDDMTTVIIGTTDEPSGLDSGTAYAIHDWEILKNTGDALLGYVPGTSELVPALAAEMPTASEDGLTYTFTLREGVEFADGTPLTAQVVADSFTRALTLEGDISGFVAGFVESVEATGDLTVEFHLTQPFGFFPALAATAPFIPMNPNQFPVDELNATPDTIDGVGAYRMVEYVPGEQLVLEVNENYWDESVDPHFDRVIVRYFADPTTMSLAVENGEIDVAWRILGSTEAARLQEVESVNVIRIDAPSMRYLVVNHEIPPHDNNNINQALAASIDREAIVDRVFEGRATPAYSMVPAGVPYATEAFLDVYGFQDLDRARELLEGEGYSEDNPLEITLWYPPEHYGVTTADWIQVIQEQIESTGMINVTLESQNWGEYVGALVAGEYPFAVLGWFPDYIDPDTWLSPFASCTQSANLGINYCTDEMEEYLTAGGTSTDPAVREEAYANAQELWTQHVPTIPLLTEPEYITARDGIDGILIGAPFEFHYRELFAVE